MVDQGQHRDPAPVGPRGRYSSPPPSLAWSFLLPAYETAVPPPGLALGSTQGKGEGIRNSCVCTSRHCPLCQEFTQMPLVSQHTSTYQWPDLGHLVIRRGRGVWETENIPNEIQVLMVSKRENPDYPGTRSGKHLPFLFPGAPLSAVLTFSLTPLT